MCVLTWLCGRKLCEKKNDKNGGGPLCHACVKSDDFLLIDFFISLLPKIKIKMTFLFLFSFFFSHHAVKYALIKS